MAQIDIEALLAPLGDDAPCGPDFEYEPAFDALQRAAKGKEARWNGTAEEPAEPPNWREVADQAIALFDQTKDLRVGTLLLEALARTQGAPGLHAGLTLLHDLLEQQWDHVHPQLEADGDSTLRANSLMELNKPEGLLQALGNLTLVSTRGVGTFTLRDVRLSNGTLKAGGDEELPDPGHIAAAFAGADPEELGVTVTSLQKAYEISLNLQRLLDDQIPDTAPKLESMTRELKALNDAIVPFAGTVQDSAEAGDAADEGAAGAAPGAAVARGPIRTREDALRNLEEVCEYFRKHEPSSPVPLLLNRAKRLISKDFVEILRDLTPSGVEQALLIGGIEEGNEEN